MKKLALILAIAMVAAFTAPAMATDVSVSGEFRTLAVYTDTGYMNPNTGVSKFFEQRLRTQVVFKANDNVSVTWRGDLTETVWGNEAQSVSAATQYTRGESLRQPSAGATTLNNDRAFATIKSGMFTLTAGQFFWAAGLGTIFDGQVFGAKASFNLKPVSIDLFYSKLDEGSTANGPGGRSGVLFPDGYVTEEDEDLYLLQVKYAADNFTLGGVLAERIDRNQANQDETLTAFGVFGIMKIDALTLKAALDMFNGDATLTSDYDGTQAMFAADYALNDALSLGAAVIYAKAADGGDTQATTTFCFGVTNSLEWSGTLAATRGGLSIANLFDFDGTNSGVVGIIGNVKYMATDAITLWAKAAYLEPESDNATTRLDSFTVGIAELDYAWMPNVVIGVGAEYFVPEFKNATTNDDSYLQMVAKLGVSF